MKLMLISSINRVFTPYGVRKIGEIKENDIIYGISNDFALRSYRVVKINNTKKRDTCVSIITDHTILTVMRHNYIFTEQRGLEPTESIRIGDHLLSLYGLPIFSKSFSSLYSSMNDKKMVGLKTIKGKKNLDFKYLRSYIIGEDKFNVPKMKICSLKVEGFLLIKSNIYEVILNKQGLLITDFHIVL